METQNKKTAFSTDSADPTVKQQLLSLLQLHYGYTSFRLGQEKAIDHILAGKNTIVIMPTGGGKSLIYQLPALVLEGVTIVVSPLIALMKDQVDGLIKNGIPATFINSSITPAETLERLEAVKNGHYKILYVAPERFYSQEFLNAMQNIKVSLFAIDEAHCISQWGHDFRPSYLKIKQAVTAVGNPIVVALTATATPEVREDIIKQLGIENPEQVVTGFSRPNLQFGVIQASDSEKFRLIVDAVNSAPDGTGIVYTGTRNKAEQIAQVLLDQGVDAVVYHAGMSGEDRHWVQENFMNNKAKVIVATNAFGLGIDKRDIRFVVHFEMPGTIEAYYQEAGRAGRDGKPSFCLLFYHPRDRYLQEFFIKGDNPPPNIVLEIYELLLNYGTDNILITYSELAEGLSDKLPEMAIGTSLKILEREGYLSRPNEKVGSAYLELIARPEAILESLGTRSKSSIEIFKKLISRYHDEITNGWRFNPDETAEILNIKKDSLMRLVRKLADAQLVKYEPPFRGTEINILKRVDSSEINIDFSAMKAKQKNAYAKLDQMEEYIYHFDCRQKYILDYFGDLNAKPCGKCDNCLTGGGYQRKNQAPKREIKAKEKFDYQKYNKKKNSSFSSPFSNLENEKENTESEIKKTSLLSTKLTQLETLDLFVKGSNIDEIATARELATSTIAGHLLFLIEKKLIKNIDKLVPLKRQDKILKAIKELGPDKLTPIKESLGEEFDWDEIKFVIALERSKAGK